jgi:hypothetical protein
MSIVDPKVYNCRNEKCIYKHLSKVEVEKSKDFCLEYITKSKSNDKGELAGKFKDFFNMT